MIALLRAAPAWVLDHPILASLAAIAAMTGFALLILLNPDDRQLRTLWRRKR